MSGTLDEAYYTESKSYDGETLILASDITNEIRASKYADSFSFSGADWFGDWLPVGFTEELENKYYDFQCNNENAYNQTIQGSTGTWNGLSIDATTGKVAPNSGANCTQINTGSFITIPVQADCIVTVTAYSGQGNGKLTLSQSSDTATATGDVISINAVKGKVTLTAIGNTYINSIEVIYS